MDYPTSIISDCGEKLDVEMCPNGIYATDGSGNPYFISWSEFVQLNRCVADYQAELRSAAE